MKGFELTVINMKGDYLNYRVCVTFDLSKATWRDSDIRNGVSDDSVPEGVHFFLVLNQGNLLQIYLI